jgi:hypothetical protein
MMLARAPMNCFPIPLGKPVVLTHFVDANLYHDWITGRSVTGILSLVNQTPIDWYSKKQSTVEMATYGSEFIASRICVDRAVDLRNTLRYLGVPIRHRDVMFGDNESVVNSSTRLDAKLHKRHNALSFHRVREAIAAGYIQYFHVPGKSNPADDIGDTVTCHGRRYNHSYSGRVIPRLSRKVTRYYYTKKLS